MTLLEGIASARLRIDEAAAAAGRADTVSLQLAVKTRTPDECREAAEGLASLGLPVLLGHNRVQEATATAPAIREVPGSRISLIGPLQTNKINRALACVDAIDTIDSPGLVDAIDARAQRIIDVLVQVNVSAEPSKHGVRPDDAPRLVDAVVESEHLRLAGFMTVGLNSPVEADVRAAYADLRRLRDDTADRVGVATADLDLSMGMSGDLEWAVAEGATIVRLGTAVFGPRRP
ncbi:YggS family pyridoxal phosphate enzyme [Actinomyces sp. B33]|uniref:YggS family pyridoxal phosphate enzyme n=1 Tax=Actinomyces sp. B33 TaxID=2942131 RepID=UPI002340AE32|nr:YggS family pyridoxal phosphate enzyme [Actinomyces sp. B33]MDC4232758.1 YggS family pyridoxal phosphate enzyme [Actinomyces sp. B33]